MFWVAGGKGATGGGGREGRGGGGRLPGGWGGRGERGGQGEERQKVHRDVGFRSYGRGKGGARGGDPAEGSRGRWISSAPDGSAVGARRALPEKSDERKDCAQPTLFLGAHWPATRPPAHAGEIANYCHGRGPCHRHCRRISARTRRPTETSLLLVRQSAFAVGDGSEAPMGLLRVSNPGQARDSRVHSH